jgi:hypothetical protein
MTKVRPLEIQVEAAALTCRVSKEPFQTRPGSGWRATTETTTRFEPDPSNRQTKPFKESDERFRLARDLSFPHDLAASIDNAPARQFQRYVNSGMLFHICPPFAEPNQWHPVSHPCGGHLPHRSRGAGPITASNADNGAGNRLCCVSFMVK